MYKKAVESKVHVTEKRQRNHVNSRGNYKEAAELLGKKQRRERRSGIDRRSKWGDRRTRINIEYFLKGGAERRSWNCFTTSPKS